MFKPIALLSIPFLLILGACSSSEEKGSESDKLKVYASTFATASIARDIGGDDVDVELVVPAGADPHSYEPTSKQMTEIAGGDLFLMTGTTLEPYAEKIKDSLEGTDVKFVETSTGIKLLEVAETVHSHEEEDHSEEDGHGHGQFDPHVWLDPANAQLMAQEITKAFKKEAPDASDAFEKRLATFDEKAAELDRSLQEAVDAGSKKELLVTHAAYGYLAEKYGFEQLPVAGITPSEEPSQKELAELVAEAELHGLKYIAFEETVSPKVARVIQREIGAEAVTIHNLESVAKSDLDASYFELMEENAATLKKALD